MTYRPIDAETFIRIRNQMPQKYLVFITPYSAAEYAEMGATCYINDDRRSGYAITTDNDLVSVFSLPGASQGKVAVHSAIENGAETLDCIGEFLAAYYSSFGFVEVKRIGWDDAYAPEGWDYETFGRPDIIFMRR